MMSYAFLRYFILFYFLVCNLYSLCLPQDMDSVNHPHSECYQQKYHELIATLHNGCFELKDLHRRIQAVEMGVIEKVNLETLENLNSTRKQETLMIKL